jgi:hypothetical protein
MQLALWKCGCEGLCSAWHVIKLLFNNNHQRQQNFSSRNRLDTLVVVMSAVNLWKGGKQPLAATLLGWLVNVAVCGKAGKIRCGELMMMLG